MKDALQSLPPAAQQANRDLDVADRTPQVVGPWLTSREACVYLRFTGKHCLRSLYRFLDEQGVPTARRGGSLLIARRDLDRALGVSHRVG